MNEDELSGYPDYPDPDPGAVGIIGESLRMLFCPRTKAMKRRVQTEFWRYWLNGEDRTPETDVLATQAYKTLVLYELLRDRVKEALFDGSHGSLDWNNIYEDARGAEKGIRWFAEGR